MKHLIEQHYRENFERLSKITARRFSDRLSIAEEAVQEAYLRAYKYIHTFDDDIKPFEHWFSTILNNAVKDLQRDERASGIRYDDEMLTDNFSVVAPKSPDELIALHKAITEHHEREILTYFFILGLKPREIFELVDGRTVHAIKSVVYRFRKEFSK